MKLPPIVTAALDALEACYPTYSANAARARAEAERIIGEALSAAAEPRSTAVLHLVAGAGGTRGAR